MNTTDDACYENQNRDELVKKIWVEYVTSVVTNTDKVVNQFFSNWSVNHKSYFSTSIPMLIDYRKLPLDSFLTHLSISGSVSITSEVIMWVGMTNCSLASCCRHKLIDIFMFSAWWLKMFFLWGENSSARSEANSVEQRNKWRWGELV